jgi:hypothetical protein
VRVNSDIGRVNIPDQGDHPEELTSHFPRWACSLGPERFGMQRSPRAVRARESAPTKYGADSRHGVSPHRTLSGHVVCLSCLCLCVFVCVLSSRCLVCTVGRPICVCAVSAPLRRVNIFKKVTTRLVLATYNFLEWRR